MNKEYFKIKRNDIKLSDSSLSFIGIITTNNGYLAEELRSIQCHSFDGHGKPRPITVERKLEFSPVRQDIFSPSSTEEERVIEAAQSFCEKRLEEAVKSFYGASHISYITEEKEIVFSSSNASGYYQVNPISPQGFADDITMLGFTIVEEKDLHSGDYRRKIWG